MIDRISDRLSDPERTRWTCETGCSDCEGSGWMRDWGAQCEIPCLYARPVGAVSVALWWTDRLAWWADWHARDLWRRRPKWVQAWWWRWKLTGEIDIPF